LCFLDLNFPEFQVSDFQISRNLAWAGVGPGRARLRPWTGWAPWVDRGEPLGGPGGPSAGPRGPSDKLPTTSFRSGFDPYRTCLSRLLSNIRLLQRCEREVSCCGKHQCFHFWLQVQRPTYIPTKGG